MIIKIRLNENDNLIYKLCEWSVSQFINNPILKLQTSDLNNVKENFVNISKIEVFQANVLIAEFTEYDTYSSITYLGRQYVAHENLFADCLEVTLQKTTLEAQIQRIENALNTNVDIDSMTIAEYRKYVLTQVSKDCEADIYAGTTIEINGESQAFSFKAEDQINLLQLYLMTTMYPTITAVPYHSNGQTCMFYTAEQIKTIYTTLIIRLISLTTYANQLNLYIQTLTTKEELSNVTYGMTLPVQYEQVVADIVAQTIAALQDLNTSNETSENNN